MEDSAHPFKTVITSVRTAAMSTGEGEAAGEGEGEAGAGEARGLLLVFVVVVVLVVRSPSVRVLLAPPPFLLPSSSHAPRPTTASTSTVAPIATGMTSEVRLRAAVCCDCRGIGAVTKSCWPASVGRGCCGVVTGALEEGAVGSDAGSRISVGGGSSEPLSGEGITRVFPESVGPVP